MHLRHRAGTHQDFEALWATCFSGDQDKPLLRGLVAWEWHTFLNVPTTLTMLVEDTDRMAPSVHPAGSGDASRAGSVPPEAFPSPIVGCAQLVFVNEAFVAQACSGHEPWINKQAAHPLHAGPSALLTPAEVAVANAGNGLNALLSRWIVASDWLTPEEEDQVGGYLTFEFPAFTRGYRYKEILVEALGKKAQRAARKSGFRRRVSFDALWRKDGRTGERPMVMGINQQEAETISSLMSCYFGAPRPRLGLRPKEQALLRAALQHVSDGEIAADCDPPVSEATIKKRWLDIFPQVEAVLPGLLPVASQEGKRGEEKRASLLHYLRSHPEELRPYQPAKSRTSRKSRQTVS